MDRVSASGAEERSSSLRGGARKKSPHGGFFYPLICANLREKINICFALQFMRDEKVYFDMLAGDLLRGVQFFCGCDRSGYADRAGRHFDVAALADIGTQ